MKKLYEQTPVANHSIHARIPNGTKLTQFKRELVKNQAEYDMFKEYKVRIAISR